MCTFRAMNTEVTVAAPGLDERGAAALARDVAAVFDDAERRFSRFRADSELSRINRAVRAFPVSAPMLEALRAARHHTVATGGLFDPAIGAALAAAGYDRSFAPGALDRDRPAPPTAPPRPGRAASVASGTAPGSS